MTQNYNIRNIQGGAVAVGNHAHATSISPMQPSQLAAKEAAIAELRRFIELLPAHVDQVDSPQQVHDDAKAAEQALTKKKLDRARIIKLIRRIALGVAGVTALANAIGAVDTAVTQLFT